MHWVLKKTRNRCLPLLLLGGLLGEGVGVLVGTLLVELGAVGAVGLGALAGGLFPPLGATTTLPGLTPNAAFSHLAPEHF